MKVIRNVISIILLGGMLLIGLTGCISHDEIKPGGELGDTIKIGYMSDVSGDLGTTGPLHATELAVEEINAMGGVLGKPIELVAVDTQSDTQRFQEMARWLILEKEVTAIFTNGISATREAIRPMIEKNEIVYFYSSFYEGGVASKYVFTTGAVPEQQVLPILNYAKENNLGSRMFIVSADYNYGQISTEWVQRYAEGLGIEVVGVDYVPLGEAHFEDTVNKIQDSDADLLFTLLVGDSQYSFFEQWSVADVEGVEMISSALFSNYEHLRFNSPTLDNAYSVLTYFEELNTEEGRAFADKIKERYPEEIYITCEMETAYNSIYLWKEAVELAGSTKSDKVIEALESGDICVEGPGGTVTMEGETHQAVLNIYIVQCDANHTLNMVMMLEEQKPTYLKSLGIDLRENAINKQFSPLITK